VVELQISDNGPGIPEDLTGKVFQPFFTTKEEGTGLGLSIVERIVREHGARIRLEPHHGVGATFVITLPVTKIPDCATESETHESNAIASSSLDISSSPKE
jgi:signal transduction histidine kinase